MVWCQVGKDWEPTFVQEIPDFLRTTLVITTGICHRITTFKMKRKWIWQIKQCINLAPDSAPASSQALVPASNSPPPPFQLSVHKFVDLKVPENLVKLLADAFGLKLDYIDCAYGKIAITCSCHDFDKEFTTTGPKFEFSLRSAMFKHSLSCAKKESSTETTHVGRHGFTPCYGWFFDVVNNETKLPVFDEYGVPAKRVSDDDDTNVKHSARYPVILPWNLFLRLNACCASKAEEEDGSHPRCL